MRSSTFFRMLINSNGSSSMRRSNAAIIEYQCNTALSLRWHHHDGEMTITTACLQSTCDRTNRHEMEDHDLPLYFRRAKAAEIAFGDARFYRKKVARELGFKVA